MPFYWLCDAQVIAHAQTAHRPRLGCRPHLIPRTHVRGHPRSPPPRSPMRILPSALRTRLAVESLEERTVPTTPTLTGNGVLTVLGSGGNDVIQISQANGHLGV